MAASSTRALPRRRISRPDLSRRIREALEWGSLLVVADAGFGKTLALEEALAGWRTAAWVSCSEADRDPGRLVVSVLAALRRAVPGAVDVVAERLTAGAGTVDPLLAAREVAAELDALLVEPVVVVLDDAERLVSSQAAANLVAQLLSARSRLRLAVASRLELPLRTAKLRASGEMIVLRTDELAFTEDECARFLANRTDREPLPRRGREGHAGDVRMAARARARRRQRRALRGRLGVTSRDVRVPRPRGSWRH